MFFRIYDQHTKIQNKYTRRDYTIISEHHNIYDEIFIPEVQGRPFFPMMVPEVIEKPVQPDFAPKKNIFGVPEVSNEMIMYWQKLRIHERSVEIAETEARVYSVARFRDHIDNWMNWYEYNDPLMHMRRYAKVYNILPDTYIFLFKQQGVLSVVNGVKYNSLLGTYDKSSYRFTTYDLNNMKDRMKEVVITDREGKPKAIFNLDNMSISYYVWLKQETYIDDVCSFKGPEYFKLFENLPYGFSYNIWDNYLKVKNSKKMHSKSNTKPNIFSLFVDLVMFKHRKKVEDPDYRDIFSLPKLVYKDLKNYFISNYWNIYDKELVELDYYLLDLENMYLKSLDWLIYDTRVFNNSVVRKLGINFYYIFEGWWARDLRIWLKEKLPINKFLEVGELKKENFLNNSRYEFYDYYKWAYFRSPYWGFKIRNLEDSTWTNYFPLNKKNFYFNVSNRNAQTKHLHHFLYRILKQFKAPYAGLGHDNNLRIFMRFNSFIDILKNFDYLLTDFSLFKEFFYYYMTLIFSNLRSFGGSIEYWGEPVFFTTFIRNITVIFFGSTIIWVGLLYFIIEGFNTFIRPMFFQYFVEYRDYELLIYGNAGRHERGCKQKQKKEIKHDTLFLQEFELCENHFNVEDLLKIKPLTFLEKFLYAMYVLLVGKHYEKYEHYSCNREHVEDDDDEDPVVELGNSIGWVIDTLLFTFMMFWFLVLTKLNDPFNNYIGYHNAKKAKFAEKYYNLMDVDYLHLPEFVWNSIIFNYSYTGGDFYKHYQNNKYKESRFWLYYFFNWVRFDQALLNFYKYTFHWKNAVLFFQNPGKRDINRTPVEQFEQWSRWAVPQEKRLFYELKYLKEMGVFKQNLDFVILPSLDIGVVDSTGNVKKLTTNLWKSTIFDKWFYLLQNIYTNSMDTSELNLPYYKKFLKPNLMTDKKFLRRVHPGYRIADWQAQKIRDEVQNKNEMKLKLPKKEKILYNGEVINMNKDKSFFNTQHLSYSPTDFALPVIKRNSMDFFNEDSFFKSREKYKHFRLGIKTKDFSIKDSKVLGSDYFYKFKKSAVMQVFGKSFNFNFSSKLKEIGVDNSFKFFYKKFYFCKDFETGKDFFNINSSLYKDRKQEIGLFLDSSLGVEESILKTDQFFKVNPLFSELLFNKKDCQTVLNLEKFTILNTDDNNDFIQKYGLKLKTKPVKIVRLFKRIEDPEEFYKKGFFDRFFMNRRWGTYSDWIAKDHEDEKVFLDWWSTTLWLFNYEEGAPRIDITEKLKVVSKPNLFNQAFFNEFGILLGECGEKFRLNLEKGGELTNKLQIKKLEHPVNYLREQGLNLTKRNIDWVEENVKFQNNQKENLGFDYGCIYQFNRFELERKKPKVITSFEACQDSNLVFDRNITFQQLNKLRDESDRVKVNQYILLPFNNRDLLATFLENKIKDFFLPKRLISTIINQNIELNEENVINYFTNEFIEYMKTEFLKFGYKEFMVDILFALNRTFIGDIQEVFFNFYGKILKNYEKKFIQEGDDYLYALDTDLFLREALLRTCVNVLIDEDTLEGTLTTNITFPSLSKINVEENLLVPNLCEIYLLNNKTRFIPLKNLYYNLLNNNITKSDLPSLSLKDFNLLKYYLLELVKKKKLTNFNEIESGRYFTPLEMKELLKIPNKRFFRRKPSEVKIELSKYFNPVFEKVLAKEYLEWEDGQKGQLRFRVNDNKFHIIYQTFDNENIDFRYWFINYTFGSYFNVINYPDHIFAKLLPYDPKLYTKQFEKHDGNYPFETKVIPVEVRSLFRKLNSTDYTQDGKYIPTNPTSLDRFKDKYRFFGGENRGLLLRRWYSLFTADLYPPVHYNFEHFKTLDIGEINPRAEVNLLDAMDRFKSRNLDTREEYDLIKGNYWNTDYWAIYEDLRPSLIRDFFPRPLFYPGPSNDFGLINDCWELPFEAIEGYNQLGTIKDYDKILPIPIDTYISGAIADVFLKRHFFLTKKTVFAREASQFEKLPLKKIKKYYELIPTYPGLISKKKVKSYDNRYFEVEQPSLKKTADNKTYNKFLYFFDQFLNSQVIHENIELNESFLNDKTMLKKWLTNTEKKWFERLLEVRYNKIRTKRLWVDKGINHLKTNSVKPEFFNFFLEKQNNGLRTTHTININNSNLIKKPSLVELIGWVINKLTSSFFINETKSRVSTSLVNNSTDLIPKVIPITKSIKLIELDISRDMVSSMRDFKSHSKLGLFKINKYWKMETIILKKIRKLNGLKLEYGRILREFNYTAHDFKQLLLKGEENYTAFDLHILKKYLVYKNLLNRVELYQYNLGLKRKVLKGKSLTLTDLISKSFLNYRVVNQKKLLERRAVSQLLKENEIFESLINKHIPNNSILSHKEVWNLCTKKELNINEVNKLSKLKLKNKFNKNSKEFFSLGCNDNNNKFRFLKLVEKKKLFFKERSNMHHINSNGVDSYNIKSVPFRVTNYNYNEGGTKTKQLNDLIYLKYKTFKEIREKLSFSKGLLDFRLFFLDRIGSIKKTDINYGFIRGIENFKYGVVLESMYSNGFGYTLTDFKRKNVKFWNKSNLRNFKGIPLKKERFFKKFLNLNSKQWVNFKDSDLYYNFLLFKNSTNSYLFKKNLLRNKIKLKTRRVRDQLGQNRGNLKDLFFNNKGSKVLTYHKLGFEKDLYVNNLPNSGFNKILYFIENQKLLRNLIKVGKDFRRIRFLQEQNKLLRKGIFSQVRAPFNLRNSLEYELVYKRFKRFETKQRHSNSFSRRYVYGFNEYILDRSPRAMYLHNVYKTKLKMFTNEDGIFLDKPLNSLFSSKVPADSYYNEVLRQKQSSLKAKNYLNKNSSKNRFFYYDVCEYGLENMIYVFDNSCFFLSYFFFLLVLFFSIFILLNYFSILMKFYKVIVGGQRLICSSINKFIKFVLFSSFFESLFFLNLVKFFWFSLLEVLKRNLRSFKFF